MFEQKGSEMDEEKLINVTEKWEIGRKRYEHLNRRSRARDCTDII